MKYRGIILVAALSVTLFLPTTMLWSQKSAASVPFKTCLFPTVDLSASEEFREYQSIISNQLHSELKNAGFEIIPREEWESVIERNGVRVGDLYQGNVALGIAEEVDAEIALVSFYSVADRQMVLEIKCYDVTQKAMINGVFKIARVNLSIYNVIGEAVTELIPGIHLLGPPPVVDSPVVEEIALLSADEDAEIYLGDEGFVGRISDGKLLLPPIPFALGTKISVEKRKEGYHTGIETLNLKEPEMIIKLERLRKQTRTATELNWTVGQLLGFGLAQRFYLRPDLNYLSAEHYFYVQHNLSDSKPVFHHDLRALFGGYLFTGPDRAIRFNISTGFGMIATYFALADQPMYADFYWNLVNLALELNFLKFMLFVRLEQKYALGLGPANLLGRGWISAFGEGPTSFTLGFAWKW